MTSQLQDSTQHRQYASPSLTPSHKYRAGETVANQPPSGAGTGAPEQTGQAMLPNNIILNINGTTNINNYHHHGPSSSMSVNQALTQAGSQTRADIRGRKVMPPVKGGKDGPQSNNNQQQIRNAQAQKEEGTGNPQPTSSMSQSNPAGKGGKAATLISRKLLDQAKSAKNARITPKGLMQKSAKAAQAQQKEGKQSTQQQASQPGKNAQLYQTGRLQQQQKAQSQFDFNFNSTGHTTNQMQGNNVTLDYDAHQRRGTLHPPPSGETYSNGQMATSGRNPKSRRQSSYSFKNLQSVINGKKKGDPDSKQNNQKSAKSSRPLAQAKQAQTFTKHRRNKTEIRKSHQQPSRPVTKVNTLLKQANTTITNAKRSVDAGKRTKRTEQQNKENMNLLNLSGERQGNHNQMASTAQQSRAAAQTVTNKSHHVRNQDGLSISSFSSGSGRMQGEYQQGAPLHLANQAGQQHHQTGSIAQQLSKSYFLNSKQLLRHLSPVRLQSQIEKSQGMQQRGSVAVPPQGPPTSQCGEIGGNSGLSQRQQPFRGRTRSTAAAHSTAPQGKPQGRKPHSHSQSRSQNNPQLQTLRNHPQLQNALPGESKGQSSNNNQNQQAAGNEVGLPKSKGTNNAQSTQQAQSSSLNKPNKQAVDKLIKQNIRRNKNKLEDAQIKKQLEELKQKQRRAELSQRNQQVRMINASKIVNQGQQVSDFNAATSAPREGDSQARQQSKEASHRRRSYSCIDYSNKKAGTTTSGGERKQHHSQEHQRNQNNQQSAQIENNNDHLRQRPIPHTTTNRVNKAGKPRSFVDEINQLTHLVEKEIGHDQFKSHTSGRAQKTNTGAIHQKSGGSRGGQHKVKSSLNETTPDFNERSMLSPQMLAANTTQITAQNKKAVKKERASAAIQKFIERKKREEQVKRSLEQTIEVDKHLKIQQNLVNLDKYVKKHLRQRSQPAISQKNKGVSGLNHAGKLQARKSKRAKQRDPLKGLSEIFFQDYLNANQFVDLDHQTPNHQGERELPPTAELDQPGRSMAGMGSGQGIHAASLNSSVQSYGNTQQEHQGQTTALSDPRPGKGSRQKSGGPGKKTSNVGSAKQTKVNKSSSQDKGNLSAGGTRAAAGTRSKRASHDANQKQMQIPNGRYYRELGQSREEAQTEVTQPSKSPQLLHPSQNPGKKLYGKRQSESGDVNTSAQLPQQVLLEAHRLKSKHPGASKTEGNRRHPEINIIVDDQVTPTINTREQNYLPDSSQRLSPKSTEHIRRVHELVALYRCRFKPNLSDASVMGTLHSAASVIQIHFRYLRHLREAGLRQPPMSSQAPPPETNLNLQRNGSDPYLNSDKLSLIEFPQEPGPYDAPNDGDWHEFNQIVRNPGVFVGYEFPDPNSSERQPAGDKSGGRTSDDYIYTSEKGPEGRDPYNQGSSLESSQHGRNIKKPQMLDQPISFYHPNEMNDQSDANQEASAEVIRPGKRARERAGSGTLQESRNVINEYGKQQVLKTSNTKNETAPKDARQRKPSPNLPKLNSLAQEDPDLSLPLNRQTSNELSNKSPMPTDSKGQKTPQIPNLDLKRLITENGKVHSNNASRKDDINVDANIKPLPDIIIDGPPHQSTDREVGERAWSQEPPNKNQPIQPLESPSAYSGDREPAQSVQSFNSIFNRIGLPLPRSVRVKIDYDILQRDPNMSEQLRNVVRDKGIRGKHLLDKGLQEQLITERTYEINRQRLERWVSAQNNNIDENQRKRQMIRDAYDGHFNGDRVSEHSARYSANGVPSIGNRSVRSQSGRIGSNAAIGNHGLLNYNPGNFYIEPPNQDQHFTDRNPYGNKDNGDQPAANQPNLALGSGRGQPSKIVGMIMGDVSSGTSSKPKDNQSGSDKIPGSSSNGANNVEPHDSGENIDLKQIDDQLIILPQQQLEGNTELKHQQTDNSLKRSESFPSIPKDKLAQEREQEDKSSQIVDSYDNKNPIDTSQIQINLEEELENQQKLEQNENASSVSSPAQDKSSGSKNKDQRPEDYNSDLKQIRDHRFFLNKVGDDNENPSAGKSNKSSVQTDGEDQNEGKKSDANNDSVYSKKNPFKTSVASSEESGGQWDAFSKVTKDKSNLNNTALTGLEDNASLAHMNTSGMDTSGGRSPSSTAQKLIKVENQQFEPQDQTNQTVQSTQKDSGQKSQGTDASQNKNRSLKSVEFISETDAPGHPVSPVSDSVGFDNRIQTGAHSLSSTDSDMARAIAKGEVLDSPPNLISPKNSTQPQLTVIDQQEPGKDKNVKEGEELVDLIYEALLADLVNQIEEIVPRGNQGPVVFPPLKFFEKKGIKTDLFAIEKYVDEVLEEVKGNRKEFMIEINRPLAKDARDVLFQMKNSEIGSYEHFQSNLPPVLSLDLYLKLEKRRKESRENPKEGQPPDGRFDFDNVNEEELLSMGVDKNTLAECQHIHNKVLFDSINDSLQQFRPYGKDGMPMAWSRLGRKLKPTEDFTLEEMFEITKHDLFRMAIMQAGTLPRREFVFGGKFDEELFAEIREKKLATLLCREIVETEPQWLKWDFEEAQTKIVLADVVLDTLVKETAEFLNSKANEKSAAQIQFEQLEQMIKSKS